MSIQGKNFIRRTQYAMANNTPTGGIGGNARSCWRSTVANTSARVMAGAVGANKAIAMKLRFMATDRSASVFGIGDAGGAGTNCIYGSFNAKEMQVRALGGTPYVAVPVNDQSVSSQIIPAYNIAMELFVIYQPTLGNCWFFRNGRVTSWPSYGYGPDGTLNGVWDGSVKKIPGGLEAFSAGGVTNGLHCT